MVLCAAAAVGAGVTAKIYGPSATAARHTFKPYTLTWQVTIYDDKGNGTPVGTFVRYQSKTGSWRELRYFASGGVEEIFSDPYTGMYRVGQGKDNFRYHGGGRTEPPPTPNAALTRSSNQFLREEVVQGYHVFVMKAGPGEVSVADALNHDPIRFVMPYDSRSVQVIEPVSIVEGEPPADKIKHRPVDQPVDYSNFEKMYPSAPHP
jgi:hypothetical protein